MWGDTGGRYIVWWQLWGDTGVTLGWQLWGDRLWGGSCGVAVMG